MIKIYDSYLNVLLQKSRVEERLQTLLARRIAQLDNGEVELMNGPDALKVLKERSIGRVGELRSDPILKL